MLVAQLQLAVDGQKCGSNDARCVENVQGNLASGGIDSGESGEGFEAHGGGK